MIKHLLRVAVLSAIIGSTSMAQRQFRSAERPADLINDVDQSTVALHPATPYVESSTMFLADVDLEKFDAGALGQWLREVMGGPQEDPAVEMLGGFVDSMKAAGASHIYVTAATRSMIDNGPVVIVPCENPAVVQGLLTVLVQNAPKQQLQKVHVGDRIVLAGPTAAIDRVTSGDGVDRPDLVLPLKRDGLLDHTAVISLPEEARRDLVALWPERMPAESPVQLSPRAMAADISHIVVSLRLPPDPLMLVQVETTDAIAAERVQKAMEPAVALGNVKSSVEITVDVATVKLRASPEAFARIAKAVISPSRRRATQAGKSKSMKQIGLAIHNYYAQHNHLPPRCFTDEAGNPLHSIRVALLPHLEQAAMYKLIKLDQRWNSDDNQKFADTRIPVYCDDPDRSAKTTIRFPVYPGSVWHGEGPPKDFRSIIDGTSNTIAAVDAPENVAIEWPNPEPWVLSVDDPMSDIFGDRDSVTVLMLDGAAVVLQKADVTNEKLKGLLTIAGREKIKL